MNDETLSEERVAERRLLLDYETTVKYFLALADTRFRLLALVPTITGIAVALLARNPDPLFVLPIGLLGFFATIGIIFYDQRNTTLYDAAQLRLKSLEALLEFRALHDLEQDPRDRKAFGGSFLGRPGRGLKLFGFIPMWHDLGLDIVYSAALGAWSFLIVVSLTKNPVVLVVVPIAIAVLLLWGLLKLDNPTDEFVKLREEIQRLVWPRRF